jgi:folate-dependent phosphoribosylglycinamide formyltransferase PurN
VRVVVLAPVDNSPFSRSVAALCHREPGIELAGVIVRRVINPSRLRVEWQRDGVRLIRKAWKKLVLGSEDGVADDERGFNDIAREIGVKSKRLSHMCREYEVPCVKVADHNDERSLAALRSMGPDVIAFTGGGIIRQPLMDASGAGIFNAHMGMLPAYRGMDVVEWPIIESRKSEPLLGVTLHFMDHGIDTGPIALRKPVKIKPGDTVESIRKRFEPIMVELLLDGLRALRDGTLSLQGQAEDDGRQYFIMHPRFYSQVRAEVARRAHLGSGMQPGLGSSYEGGVANDPT